MGILRGRFVPEGEVTFASEKVGSKNAAVITERGQESFVLIQIHITSGLRGRSCKGRIVELLSQKKSDKKQLL
jgi:hypothetical protein